MCSCRDGEPKWLSRIRLLMTVRSMDDGERMELLHLLQAGEERVKSNQSEKVSARKC